MRQGPKAWLRYTMGGRRYSVPLKGPEILVGRAGTCDVPLLGDVTVGKQHARLTLEPEGWVITDLNSRNGTRLNGERVSTQQLRDGDRIQIGSVRLTCIVEAGPVTPQVLLESGLHTERVGQLVITPAGRVNPATVGRPAPVIAALAGINVPQETRVLVAELNRSDENPPIRAPDDPG